MSFIGIPIVGDVNQGETRVNQRPQSEFAEILQEALAQPGVTELGWEQAVPYFNDGDPCVFRCHGLDRGVIDGVEFEDEFPPYDDAAKAVTGERKKRYVFDTESRTGRYEWEGSYEGPNEARFNALATLDSALSNKEFDNVLLGLFGDHATVRVTPTEIHVEFCEHD